MIWNFAERGCARIVSRSALKMLRLVSAAALRSKLPRLADARFSWQHFRDGKNESTASLHPFPSILFEVTNAPLRAPCFIPSVLRPKISRSHSLASATRASSTLFRSSMPSARTQKKSATRNCLPSEWWLCPNNTELRAGHCETDRPRLFRLWLQTSTVKSVAV